MNRLLLFITILILPHIVSASTDSIYVWNKWCSKKDTLLLFTKANNIIQLYSPSLNPDDIILKPLDRTLKIGAPEIKKDTLSVLAMPYATGDKKMKLAIIDKKTKKVIKTCIFTGDKVPDAKATFGNIQTTEALKKDIIAQTAIRVTFPNSYYSYPYRVKEYMFKIRSGSDIDSIQVTGYLVPRDVIKEIFSSKLGSEIEFKHIKASCPDCDTRILNDIKIKMK